VGKGQKKRLSGRLSLRRASTPGAGCSCLARSVAGDPGRRQRTWLRASLLHSRRPLHDPCTRPWKVYIMRTCCALEWLLLTC